MRNLAFLSCAVVLIFSVATGANAQSVSSTESSTAKPKQGVVYAGWTMVFLKPLAPFSATIFDQWTLSDGTKIDSKSDVVMRDGRGRVYRELQMPAPGEAQTEIEIRIDDPIRRTEYLCHPKGKSCITIEFRPMTDVRRPTMADVQSVAKGTPDATLEDIGAANIGGVAVLGMREIRVIPAGAIGNDRPLNLSLENWYSPELEVDVELKSSDPRWGTRTRTMTNVSLGEPDPKYFGVPEGYELTDMREPMAKAKEAQ
jgi:hypothetical protein